jgi:hypothetical protein
MSARAEQMADEMAGRLLARLSAATKAYGLTQQPPSRADLAASFLPVCKGLVPLSDELEEFSATVRKMQKTNSKIGKAIRRNERLMKAIATPASAVPMWGRGPR